VFALLESPFQAKQSHFPSVIPGKRSATWDRCAMTEAPMHSMAPGSAR